MYIPLPTKPVRRYIKSIASSAIRCVYVYIYIYQKVRKLAYMYRRYIKVPVRIYINTHTYWPSRHISVNASAWRIFHNFYIYYKYVYRSEFGRKFHGGQLVCVILWWFMHHYHTDMVDRGWRLTWVHFYSKHLAVLKDVIYTATCLNIYIRYTLYFINEYP